MKKLCLAAFCVFVSLISKGQITKGNWLVGGSVSYSSTKYNSENLGEPYKFSTLIIKPNMGYFFADKIAAGVQTNFKRSAGEESSWTEFSIGPSIRYYLLKPDKQYNILAEGYYLFGFDKGNATPSTNKSTYGLSTGPVLFLNNVVGLEMLVNYSSFKFQKINGRNNTVSISIGLQIHLEKEN